MEKTVKFDENGESYEIRQFNAHGSIVIQIIDMEADAAVATWHCTTEDAANKQWEKASGIVKAW